MDASTLASAFLSSLAPDVKDALTRQILLTTSAVDNIACSIQNTALYKEAFLNAMVKGSSNEKLTQEGFFLRNLIQEFFLTCADEIEREGRKVLVPNDKFNERVWSNWCLHTDPSGATAYIGGTFKVGLMVIAFHMYVRNKSSANFCATRMVLFQKEKFYTGIEPQLVYYDITFKDYPSRPKLRDFFACDTNSSMSS